MLKLRAIAMLLCAGMGLAAATVPVSASAQTEEETKPAHLEQARELARQGLAAYQDADYPKALELFQQARKLYPSTQIVRMEGYSLLALSHWAKAAEALETALAAQDPPLGAEDRKDVEEQLAKVLPHLGSVNLTSSVEGAALVADGGDPIALPLARPLRLEPGSHTFIVRAPEHEDAKAEVTIEAEKTIDVTLDPKPIDKSAPPPPPKPVVAPPPPPPEPKKGWFPHQRTIGFVAAGVGLAAGGAALATGLAGARIRSNVEGDVELHYKNYGQNCDRNDYRLCVFDRAIINQDADRADMLRNVSIGLAAGAGVLAAGGVVLIVFAGSDAPAAADHKANAPRERSRTEGGPAARAVMCGPMALPGLVCAGVF